VVNAKAGVSQMPYPCDRVGHPVLRRRHDASAWAPRERSTVATGVALFQPAEVAIRRFQA